MFELDELLSLPTIETGQFGKLKLEIAHYRLWVKEIPLEGSFSSEHLVTVQRKGQIDAWVTINRYVI